MSWSVSSNASLSPSIAERKLTYLGFLFRAQPTLMTLPRSATVMDEIFASPEEDGRGRLLKIIQEFLVSEASKHSAKEKGNFRTFDVHICA
jgi:cohesin loading factor subunit SCC2